MALPQQYGFCPWGKKKLNFQFNIKTSYTDINMILGKLKDDIQYYFNNTAFRHSHILGLPYSESYPHFDSARMNYWYHHHNFSTSWTVIPEPIVAVVTVESVKAGAQGVAVSIDVNNPFYDPDNPVYGTIHVSSLYTAIKREITNILGVITENNTWWTPYTMYAPSAITFSSEYIALLEDLVTQQGKQYYSGFTFPVEVSCNSTYYNDSRYNFGFSFDTFSRLVSINSETIADLATNPGSPISVNESPNINEQTLVNSYAVFGIGVGSAPEASIVIPANTTLFTVTDNAQSKDFKVSSDTTLVWPAADPPPGVNKRFTRPLLPFNFYRDRVFNSVLTYDGRIVKDLNTPGSVY